MSQPNKGETVSEKKLKDGTLVETIKDYRQWLDENDYDGLWTNFGGDSECCGCGFKDENGELAICGYGDEEVMGCEPATQIGDMMYHNRGEGLLSQLEYLQKSMAELESSIELVIDEMIKRRNDAKTFSNDYREGMDAAAYIVLKVLNNHRS